MAAILLQTFLESTQRSEAGLELPAVMVAETGETNDGPILRRQSKNDTENADPKEKIELKDMAKDHGSLSVDSGHDRTDN